MRNDIIPPGADQQAADPQLVLDSYFADFARQNPNLAWLPQMLSMKRKALAEVGSSSDLDEAESRIAELEVALARSEARCEKLIRLGDELTAELDGAYERVADAAAAVGACGQCWGEDPRCRSCRGRGKPGRFAPDAAIQARFCAEPAPSAITPQSTHPQA
jgi:hypothetical protein